MARSFVPGYNSHFHADTKYGVDPECPVCRNTPMGRACGKIYDLVMGTSLVDPREINRYGRMPVVDWVEMTVGVQEGSTAAIARQAAESGLFECCPLTDEQRTRLEWLAEQIQARLTKEAQ